MKNKTIILLSVLIVVMLGIITAAVSYLYSTPKAERRAAVENVVLAEDVKGEEIEKPVTESVAKDEAVSQAEKTAADAKVASESKSQAQTTAAEPAEFKVKNSGTGKINTLKQLEDNSLVLIDHNDKQLWKIDFPAKIAGAPAEIDIYSNMKIQYLIAADSKLHLIDRLGRQVKGFPLDLPGAAKDGPVSVTAGKVAYWKIDTSAGVVYFDKKTQKIIDKLPN